MTAAAAAKGCLQDVLADSEKLAAAAVIDRKFHTDRVEIRLKTRGERGRVGAAPAVDCLVEVSAEQCDRAAAQTGEQAVFRKADILRFVDMRKAKAAGP